MSERELARENSGGLRDTATAELPASERFRRLWEAVRKRTTRHQYTTWFQRATLVSWTGSDLVVGLPNRFYQEWFHRNFRALITGAAADVGQAPVQASFVVVNGEVPTAAGEESPAVEDSSTEPAPLEPAATPFAGTGPEDAPLRLHEHYTFENFVLGPSNRIAHASAKAVAQDPGRAYNPLFIHGSVGLGKTHLLHAVCREFRDRLPRERICFLSCEEFTNEFVQALQRHDLERFRERFRNVSLLVIDDIHFLAGKERTQEEFFHTFNRLYTTQRQIVVSSDAPPSDIPTLEDRLVSRFKWGLVAKLEPPEMETRMAIIRRKADILKIEIPNDVVEFVAKNFRSNIRELEGALLSIVARARITQTPVDLALAHQALEPALHTGRPTLTLDDITEAVATHYQVKVSELRSKRRSRTISHPRQVVMFLARRMTTCSLEEIGEAFGGRDHSTVLYAVHKMEERVASDARLSSEIARIEERFPPR